MKTVRYSLIAVVANQELRVSNYTKSEFDNLVEVIYSCGGWLVEYTVTEKIVRL